MSGIYKVFDHLFDIENGTLNVQVLPQKSIGESFETIKKQYSAKGYLAIGLLENIGDVYTRKKEKLNLAQKSGSIKTSIESLINVKVLKSNNPFFNPPNDYKVKEYSSLIVLKPSFKSLDQQEIIRRQKNRGTTTSQKFVKGDLLICGWKPNLNETIQNILQLLECTTPQWNHIRVLAKMDYKQLQELKETFPEDEEGCQVRFFLGDHVNKEDLLAAGIKGCNTVLILAESDSLSSRQEIDSRTIIASMAVENLNRKAYKIAEILDSRYTNYLTMSNVEEIIPLDKLNRIMLANGSNSQGGVNLFNTLLEIENNLVSTLPVEPKYFGRSYKEASDELAQDGKLLIGLLEYTGNFFTRKAEYVFEAQTKPQISLSIEQLRLAKKVVVNQTVIAPPADYLINKHSRFIYLN
jgi:Trk K+ transport system NAD-binding subunit